MSYTIYNVTSSSELPVVFKCERCGKNNIKMNSFSVRTTYNTRGAFSQSSVYDRQRKAYAELDVQKEALYDKIVEDTYNRDVKGTGYECVCEHCGAVPKWSKFRNPILQLLCILVNPAAVVILISGVLSHTPYLWILIAAVIAANLSLFLWKTIKIGSVKEMNEEYLPIVCENMEEAEITLKRIESNQKVSIKTPMQCYKAAVSSSGEGWKCACGKRNAPYISSCSCGMSKTAVKLQNQQKE